MVIDRRMLGLVLGKLSRSCTCFLCQVPRTLDHAPCVRWKCLPCACNAAGNRAVASLDAYGVPGRSRSCIAEPTDTPTLISMVTADTSLLFEKDQQYPPGRLQVITQSLARDAAPDSSACEYYVRGGESERQVRDLG